ncbi:DUF805 domain-containing protein [Mesobacterium sp. TK19101]|uniref:DUF805 domain-containing protein n=1 Tax=Mesobacterium hydrothermale TaxID=3111907 RepID=A0ABU6HBF9_9RHOB|nr:DUF805 domain-containing protein [Mesobacterium sp. TK19101]MEC3859789.1 DUF805 domain-containing protein [Mesobacterium sp. TK19101]
MMGPLDAVQTVYVKYFSVRGRATRAEYWWFMLFSTALTAAAVFADFDKIMRAESAADFDWNIAAWWTPYVLILNFLPYHTVTIRRLHDVGFSGFWLLMIYAPQIGYPFAMAAAMAALMAGSTAPIFAYQIFMLLTSLGFLALMLWPSQRFENRFGPSPVYHHHAVGGAALLATQTAQKGAAPAKSRKGGQKPQAHNPWNAYLTLEQSKKAQTPESQAARREEIQALYRQKILGKPAPADEAHG